MTTLAHHAPSESTDLSIVRAILQRAGGRQGAIGLFVVWFMAGRAIKQMEELRAIWNADTACHYDDAKLAESAHMLATNAQLLRVATVERLWYEAPMKARLLRLAAIIDDWAETLALSASPQVRAELSRRIDQIERRTDSNHDAGDDWRRVLAKP